MVSAASRRGVALITSLAILVVVGALVLGSILTTQVELAVTRNDSTSAQAQYAAQAGLQLYKAALFQTFRWLEAGGSSGTSLDACSNSLSDGISFLRNDEDTLFWSNNRIGPLQGTVNDIDGTVIGSYDVTLLRDPGNENRITIQSVGRTVLGGVTRQATATARGTFIIQNSSVLEQAIFSAGGSEMRFINGNTTVYGGVYITGDEELPDATVWQSNGNLGVYNAYDKSGVGDFLHSKAKSSSNLCASFRVQYGKVGIGGSSQLGTNENRLLNVAISRGLQDIDLTQGGTTECLGDKGICTETPVGPFDLESDAAPQFPRLDETLGTEYCPTGTWRQCIQDEATGDGLIISTAAGVNAASVISPIDPVNTLPAQCLNFLNNAAASTNKAMVFDNSNVDCTFYANGREVGFRYTAGTPARLHVFGNINLRGFDLVFNRRVEYTALSRSTTGADQPFSGLSLESDGAVGGTFTAKGSFTTSPMNPFPDNVLSIIAERHVDLSGQPNSTYFTAPVYVGGVFYLTTQTVLFGQVFADQFCTTGQGGRQTTCNPAGAPAEIVFVRTGSNRAKSFRAIADTGGLPTFTTVAYELR